MSERGRMRYGWPLSCSSYPGWICLLPCPTEKKWVGRIPPLFIYFKRSISCFWYPWRMGASWALLPQEGDVKLLHPSASSILAPLLRAAACCTFCVQAVPGQFLYLYAWLAVGTQHVQSLPPGLSPVLLFFA